LTISVNRFDNIIIVSVISDHIRDISIASIISRKVLDCNGRGYRFYDDFCNKWGVHDFDLFTQFLICNVIANDGTLHVSVSW